MDIRLNPLDLNPDVSIGVVLPLTNVRGKFFNVSYTTLQQAKTNLKCLLLTNEGERIMQPKFGCNLRKLVFEPIDSTLINKMKSIIENKVKFWLPYLKLNLIDIDAEPDLNQIQFNLEFSLDGNTFETDTITFKLDTP